MKPLLHGNRLDYQARLWHGAVFAAWGFACAFCGKLATDAAHVIPRALLGPLRYQMPRENGRPLCRACHRKVDGNQIAWPPDVLRGAIEAHNAIAKVPIELPA